MGSRELLCPFPAGPACGCGASATRKEDAYSCGFSLLPAKLLQASSVGSRASAIRVSRFLWITGSGTYEALCACDFAFCWKEALFLRAACSQHPAQRCPFAYPHPHTAGNSLINRALREIAAGAFSADVEKKQATTDFITRVFWNQELSCKKIDLKFWRDFWIFSKKMLEWSRKCLNFMCMESNIISIELI